MEEKELPLKIPAFVHAFCYAGRFHLITPKGLMSWSASLQDQKGFDSQIVINQVEMLQFPIEKFSAL